MGNIETEFLKDLLEKSIMCATQAHYGQRDKAGKPYILHPLRVMFAMETLPQKIVAVLHDVLEDTKITNEDLANIGLSYSLRKTLVDLTKKKNENYFTYIERVSKNSLASFVKQQDLLDNMKTERLSDLTEKDLKRLQKYHKAYLFLKNQNTNKFQRLNKEELKKALQNWCE